MSKYKIFVTDKGFQNYDKEVKELSKYDAELIFASKNDTETFISEGHDADIVINTFTEVTSEFIERLSNCRMIIRTGIGVNTINVEAATKKGIMVSYVPDYCRDEVADHSTTLALAICRKVAFLNKRVHEGVWNSVEAGYVPRINGKTFGLLGFGGIAKRVAKRMQAFGMKILAYDPYLKDEEFEQLNVKRATTVDDVFRKADMISLNLPLTDETYHIINKDSFVKMKKGVFIVNTARGPLINEDDLVEALTNGTVCGAGLDVFEVEPLPLESKLRSFENVILTPHAAYYSNDSLPELQVKTFKEVVRVLNNEKPINWFNKKNMI
jgi:D-3-phosphoglycerate dehydrogenase